MPDISQIVPLAAILGVSTDFLLGNDCNEAIDANELKLEIDKVWATYSVNTFDNNADDYMFVSKVRQKFNINEKEFVRLNAECEKMLWSICKYDPNLQRQIEARGLLIRHYMLNEQWDEALDISDLLPNIYGINQESILTKKILSAI